MDLSIIIPTKERGNIFYKTLEHSVNAIKHIHAEIIVVNDSKTSHPEIEKWINAPIILIDNVKSGVASARNAGAAIAKSDLLLFLDDDILISTKTIEQTLSVHRQEKNICVNPDWIYPPELTAHLDEYSFGRYLLKHNLTNFKGWYKNPRWKNNALFESLMIASFHLSMDKDSFLKSGGYNESFQHSGFEDYDFPVRLNKMGMRFLIDTRILVYHNEADKVDSIELWLKKQKEVAATRKHGVKIGYSELAITYPAFKKFVLRFFIRIKPLLMLLVKSIPNARWANKIYFRLVLTLQAVSIFEGYNKK
ncbi:MAG: glycosyltransferase [Bacteroidetes bacterium]|nr:glycosyltransferase [Bacteroidota bacterium]